MYMINGTHVTKQVIRYIFQHEIEISKNKTIEIYYKKVRYQYSAYEETAINFCQ